MSLKEDFQRAIAASQQGKSVGGSISRPNELIKIFKENRVDKDAENDVNDLLKNATVEVSKQGKVWAKVVEVTFVRSAKTGTLILRDSPISFVFFSFDDFGDFLAGGKLFDSGYSMKLVKGIV